MPKRQVRKRRPKDSESEGENDGEDANDDVLVALAEASLPLGRRARAHGLEAAELGHAGENSFRKCSWPPDICCDRHDSEAPIKATPNCGCGTDLCACLARDKQ